MEQLIRLDQRLDDFEDRMDQLEGQMAFVTEWLERMGKRLEQLDESRLQWMLAITQLQTAADWKAFMTDIEKRNAREVAKRRKSSKNQVARSRFSPPIFLLFV
jgi:hypothetical protein